ncbi:MAG: leucine-rich repeat domain-containing protein [Bacteroidia bacterium]|nr:leucine-rich repeat domain-containing protein [Bacteroidia bacterium]
MQGTFGKIILFVISFLFIKAQIPLYDSLHLAAMAPYTSLKAAIEDKNTVVKLVLRKKKLKKFPAEILEMPNLQYLDLSKNQIKEIPDSIIKLKKLQFLIMSKNKLEALPKTIGEFANLKYVDFSRNEIYTLPYSFGMLLQLEYADFWDNNLDEFPASMRFLQNLKYLDLRNITISKEKQDRLKAILPDTKIMFSPPCNCGN